MAKKESEKVEREFPARVATTALQAAYSLSGIASDVEGNEAQVQSDGSVRVSIKLKEGGHERVFVRVPESLVLEVVEPSE
jgi:hypothetical protein